MKKFKFSLQAVHDVRETRREQEELKLADLNNNLSRAAASLAQAETVRQKAIEEYADKMQHGEFNSYEMALAIDYMRALANREQAAREQVAHAENACQKQSQVLAVAAQAVEATNKLRDKQRARFNLEAARAEQNEIDEMVILRYTRQQR